MPSLPDKDFIHELPRKQAEEIRRKKRAKQSTKPVSKKGRQGSGSGNPSVNSKKQGKS